MQIDLTTLTTQDLRDLLEQTGYGATDEIFYSRYDKTTEHNVIYKIFYEVDDDDADQCGVGRVFVFINDKGQLACDF